MRIGVGYLLQETNNFSPVPTTVEDFGLLTGKDILGRWRGTRTEIGAFVDALSGTPCQVAPLFAGWAMTAGPILAGEWGRLRSTLLAAVEDARPLDALLLALHGSMCAEGVDDCEGELLESIRALLGPDKPIVLTLDLHANVTQRIATLADAVLGYKTYPHTDMYETGLAAAVLALRTLHGEIQPRTVLQKLPLIVPAENMQTSGGPLEDVFAEGEACRLAHPEVLSVSVFGVQPWLDVDEMGCATVAVANRDATRALACARRMARKFWESRHRFETDLIDPQRAVELALSCAGQPVVLAESSDSPTAGSPGDSADLLRVLIERAPHTSSAVWVRDPAAAELAWSLGPGAHLKTAVGGAFDRKNRRPAPVSGLVRSVSDGRYIFEGNYNRGMVADIGRTAVIDIGPIALVVSGKPANMIDLGVYRSQGVEPRDRKIVVVKSTNGFRSEYGPLAAQIMMVDTPGVSSANLRAVPYRRVPRPIHPLDDVNLDAYTGY
jgi:microcystin degradation protein MlrC